MTTNQTRLNSPGLAYAGLFLLDFYIFLCKNMNQNKIGETINGNIYSYDTD